MDKLISVVLLLISPVIRELPVNLATDLSKKAAVLVYPGDGKEEMGYKGYLKRLVDSAIDDSGKVHLLVDEKYGDYGRVWRYLKYDKNGNQLCQAEVYSAGYRTLTTELLVSRLLVNPDMTALIIYPDSLFYTCWAKLDGNGNLIERIEPGWLRGDAVFRVCSAGQDSFHIVTFPVSFWSQLIKKIHPEFGESYLGVLPSLIVQLHYSNNYALKNQRIMLPAPYMSVTTPMLLALNKNTIFCCSNNPERGIVWFMDANGKCSDAEDFEKEYLDDLCFAKLPIGDFLASRSIDLPVWSDWAGLATAGDTTIWVGVYHRNALYLLKYNMKGELVQKEARTGNLTKITEMDAERTFPFITQIINVDKRNKKTALFENTFFYWGFDNEGNFFMQTY
jgi:hypothetical protein